MHDVCCVACSRGSLRGLLRRQAACCSFRWSCESVQASYPDVVLPWLAAVSAAGSFSFSSIVAAECAPVSLGFAGRLWVAFGVSAAAVAACALVQVDFLDCRALSFRAIVPATCLALALEYFPAC